MERLTALLGGGEAPGRALFGMGSNEAHSNEGAGMGRAQTVPAELPERAAHSEQRASAAPDASRAKAVRLLWCDTAGLRRCRVVPGNRYADALDHGVGITAACMAMPAYADAPVAGSGLSPVGEARLIPVDASRVALPWCPGHQLAVVEFNAPKRAVPWQCCPRRALRHTLKMLQDNFNLQLKAGFELEFLLLERAPPNLVNGAPGGLYGSGWAPVDGSLYCQSSALDKQAAVLDDMVDALTAMGIEVLQWHPESAPGQFEIALGYGDAVQAADQVLLAKEALVGVARRHALAVSFLPKPVRNQAGSGMHVHLSLWRDGKPHMHVAGGSSSNPAAAQILAAAGGGGGGGAEPSEREQGGRRERSTQEGAQQDPPGHAPHAPPHKPAQDARGVEGMSDQPNPAARAMPSEEMLQFLGGLLEYLDCLLPFTTPSPNSFDRLKPGAWAGAHAAWGWDNREVPLRLTAPGPRRLHGMNIELKALDATANPYIALSAITVGGMLGLFGRLQPPEPCQVPPHSLDAEAAARLGVRALPCTLQQALEALQNSRAGEQFRAAMTEAIGAPLLQAHLAVRAAEQERAAHDTLPDLLLRYS